MVKHWEDGNVRRETEVATLGAGKRSLDDDGATTTTKTTKINYGPSTKKIGAFRPWRSV